MKPIPLPLDPTRKAGPIRVWIVEDNASFRNAVLQEINESEGMRCAEAFGSCEIMFETLAHSAAPDVVLLDIRLPGLSGLEAIAAVKARAPATQILMLTAFDDSERISQALTAGASGYLLKTANSDIPEAIRQVMAGGAPMSPSVARLVLNAFARLGPVTQAYQLTQREKSIMELLVEGLAKKEIADRLQLSFHTVDDNLRRIYSKLHVNNAAGAVAKALKERLV